MKRFAIKLFVGFIPALLLVILVPALLIGISNSWAAVLAGGVVFLIWTGVASILLLGVFFFNPDKYILLKSLGYGLACLIVSPFVYSIFFWAFKNIYYGTPSMKEMREDLSYESDICSITKISKTKSRLKSFYVEAEISCSPSISKKCVWWYTYTDDGWSRALGRERGCMNYQDGTLNKKFNEDAENGAL